MPVWRPAFQAVCAASPLGPSSSFWRQPLGGETPEEFSGIPWESLEELPDGLAAVRAAATIESRTDRQKALEAIADDGALPARARAAASYRLGGDALRRGRWTEAEERLDRAGAGGQ